MSTKSTGNRNADSTAEAIRCAEWMEHIASGGEVVSIEGLARQTAQELRSLSALVASAPVALAPLSAQDAERFRSIWAAAKREDEAFYAAFHAVPCTPETLDEFRELVDSAVAASAKHRGTL